MPGTELIWEERDGVLIVRPKKFTIDDIRSFCADRAVKKQTLGRLRDKRNRALAEKYARD